MIQIEQIFIPDSNHLRSFLGKVEYRKFNSWPNITDSSLVDFLFDDVQMYQESNVFFQATQDGEKIVLLVYQSLPWDTQHFGYKCGKIKYLLTNKEADSISIQTSLEKALDSFQKHCKDYGIRFVAVDVDSWDTKKNLALQKANFRYVLTWIDGISRDTKDYPDLPEGAGVGIIKPEEVRFFSTLSARHYFKGGRFYLDLGFNKIKVDEMYSKLVNFSFDNNYIMYVYRVHGNPIGLFVCNKILTYQQFSGLRVASLRFLVIDPKYRNRNMAFNLFTQTICHLRANSDLITTGFEIHNVPSLNLHLKLGFRFNYTHNIFHWWNDSL